MLVLPGLLTSDVSTRPLRSFLQRLGYAAYGWGPRRNLGPSEETARALVRRFEELRDRHVRAVSLVGWSLGGIYARELSRRFPSDVRQVITLASPFRDPDATNLPAALLALRPAHPDEAAYRARLATPLPVPSTAIYSRSDGIVSWRSCCEEPGPRSESIEVASSHLGMICHPIVLLTIADRLSQPEGQWKPFKPPMRWAWPLVPRVPSRSPDSR